MVAGCAVQLEPEARLVEDRIGQLRSERVAERQAATADLLARSPESLRHLVVPRLAVESTREPLLVATRDGSIYVGAVLGGDALWLLLSLKQGPLSGAVLRLELESIAVIRLASAP